MSDWPIAETSDNTQHSQQTDIYAPQGFKPAVPASKLPQTMQQLGSKTYICRFIILSDKYHSSLSCHYSSAGVDGPLSSYGLYHM